MRAIILDGVVISVLLLFSCGTPPTAAVRPGDSILDLLISAESESSPPSLLPEDIDEDIRNGTFSRFITSQIPHISWYDAGIPPPRFRDALRGKPEIRFWAHNPQMPGIKQDTEYRFEIIQNGLEPTVWDGRKESLPIPYIWWDSHTGLLRALSPNPPTGVSLSFPVERADDIVPLQSFRTFGTNENKRPGDLVKTITLDGISHRALFAPAPTLISIPIGRLISDTMWFSIGVIDSCLKSRDSDIYTATGCSDGVSYKIEIGARDRMFTIWETSVSPGEFNQWIQGITVDLSTFIGEFVTIRLSTFAAPGTTTAFDYALWGDLRLYGKPEKTQSQPHIILIDLDTLRRDRMSCYGYNRETTPWIDSWAEQQCIIYEDCIATSSWTLPSTATMFTGLTVDQHKIDRRSRALSPRNKPLPLRLHDAGYETYGFADGGLVGAGFGFDTGFDIYDCDDTREPGWQEAIDWVRLRSSDKPFFLFLHTYLIHAPYPHDERFLNSLTPYTGFLAGRAVDYETVIYPFLRGELSLSGKDKQYISNLYDAQILYADHHVQNLITFFEHYLSDDSYMIVLTSDHGEEFFEHGMMGHGQSLYGELLEVPMIIQYPKSADKWETGRNHSPISLSDLAPTILDVAGVPDHNQFFGMSILDNLPERRTRYATFSERVHSLQVDGYKLINGRIRNPIVSSPPVQLYRIPSDPREKNNLAEKEPIRLEELIKRLNLYTMQITANQSETIRSARYQKKDIDRLRALGYVTDGELGKTPNAIDNTQSTRGSRVIVPGDGSK